MNWFASQTQSTLDAYDASANSFALSRTRGHWPVLDIPKEISDRIQNGIVLDIGSGGGRLIDLYGLSKDTYTGIDGSAELVKVARERYPNHTFLVRRLENGWDLPRSQFDCIIALASFHHLLDIESQRRFLAQVYDTLCPGWVAIMTNWRVPAGHPTLSGSPQIHQVSLGVGERYYYAFFEEELRQRIEEAGFLNITQMLTRDQKNIQSYFFKPDTEPSL